jgi:hypothetical protein
MVQRSTPPNSPPPDAGPAGDGRRPSNAEGHPTVADIGLTHKAIHDARLIRDPRSLIISRNIQTREMSASQKAMLLAVEFPEGVGKGRKSEESSLIVEQFSSRLLEQARLINRWASDQVDGVIAGPVKFDAALKTATKNRAESAGFHLPLLDRRPARHARAPWPGKDSRKRAHAPYGPLWPI